MWWESDVMKHLRWKNQLLVAYVFKNKSLNWRNPVDSSNFDHCNIFFPKVNCDCSSCICEGGSCQSQFVSTCKFLIAHVNDLSTNGYFIPVTGRIQNLCNWKDWLCSHSVSSDYWKEYSVWWGTEIFVMSLMISFLPSLVCVNRWIFTGVWDFWLSLRSLCFCLE